jgi:hypothetical protein
VPSPEHVLLLTSPRTRRLDQPIGEDHDFQALSAADTALALAGCSSLAFAAIRWRVCGDASSLRLLRPALRRVVARADARGLFVDKYGLVADLALIAERRHVADELACAVLLADYNDNAHAEHHWRRWLRPAFGAACWELERLCGEAFAVMREHCAD